MHKSQVIGVQVGERRLDTKNGRRRIVGVTRRGRKGRIRPYCPSDALYALVRQVVSGHAARAWFDDDCTSYAGFYPQSGDRPSVPDDSHPYTSYQW